MIKFITANDKYIKRINCYVKPSDTKLYYDTEFIKPVYYSDYGTILAYGWVVESGGLYCKISGFERQSSTVYKVSYLKDGESLDAILTEDPVPYVHPRRRGIEWERSEDEFIKYIDLYYKSDNKLYFDEDGEFLVYGDYVEDIATYGIIHKNSGKSCKACAFLEKTDDNNAYLFFDNVEYKMPNSDVPPGPTPESFTYAFIRMGSEPTEYFGPDQINAYFLQTYHSEWGGQISESVSEEFLRACSAVLNGTGTAAIFDEDLTYLFSIEDSGQMGTDGNRSGMVCFVDEGEEESYYYFPWCPDLWADKSALVSNQYAMRFSPYDDEADPDLVWSGGVLTKKLGKYVYDVYHQHSTHDGHLYFEDGGHEDVSLYDGLFYDIYNQIYIQCSDGETVHTYG